MNDFTKEGKQRQTSHLQLKFKKSTCRCFVAFLQRSRLGALLFGHNLSCSTSHKYMMFDPVTERAHKIIPARALFHEDIH